MTLLWHCHGATMVLLWYSYSTVMEMPWCCYNTVMELLWCCCNTLIALLWNCHDDCLNTVMELPWRCCLITDNTGNCIWTENVIKTTIFIKSMTCYVRKRYLSSLNLFFILYINQIDVQAFMKSLNCVTNLSLIYHTNTTVDFICRTIMTV